MNDQPSQPQVRRYLFKYGSAFSIIAALFLAMIASQIYTSYQAVQTAALTNAKNLALILESDLSADFEVAEHLLSLLAAEIGVDAIRPMGASGHRPQLFHSTISRIRNISPTTDIDIFDADGNLLNSGGRSGKRVNISDSAYFQDLRNSPSDHTAFSEGIASRGSKRLSLIVGKALRDGDGVFLGVASAAIDLDPIRDRLSSLEIGKEGVVSVGRLDTEAVVMTYPGPREIDNKILPSSPFRQAILKQGPTGTMEAVSPMDGVRRIYGYRAIGRYPFYLAVGIAETDYLATWRQNSIAVILGSLIFLSILAIVSFRLAQAELQRDKIEIDERESKNRFRSLFNDAPVGQLIFEPDTNRILQCNQAAASIYGYSREFLCNARVTDFDVTLDEETLRTFRSRLLAEGTIQFDTRVQRIDGELRDMAVTVVRWESAKEILFHATHVDITERKAIEETLRKALRESEDLYNNAACGYHSIAQDRTFLKINDTELKWLGYSRDELVGCRKMPELLTQDSQQAFDDGFATLTEHGRVYGVEVDMVRKDGSILPVLLSATAVRDTQENFVMSRTTIHDLTERRAAEKNQIRLSRALRMLTDCNLCLVHAKDEQTLLAAICRFVVETGGYRMARIGFAEHDSGKSVRTVAQFGDTEGFLDGISVSWDATQDIGCGPTGTAIRTGTTQISQDAFTDSAVLPWRNAAIEHGYRSCIALPLVVHEQTLGALIVYANGQGAFNAEEVTLLEELAINLGIGIASLRAYEAHLLAGQELRLTRERLQGLFDSITDAVFVLSLDDDGTPERFIEVNDIACQSLDYSREELLAIDPMRVVAPEYHADIALVAKHLRTHKSAIVERVHLTKNGIRVPVEASSSTFILHGQTMLVILARDITERKTAERQRAEAANQLTRLSSHLETVREKERAYFARELHDELGQLLTALKMDISFLGYAVPTTDTAHAKIQDMTVLIEETLTAVHRIAAAARPIMLDDLGLKAAIEWMTEEFSKRYDGISCNLVIALGDQKIERTLVTAAYRIVQECMTNVARHAKASKIHIVVAVRDGRQLVISVQDNGIGLERQREPKNGFGLLGIRERVKALAGSFELESIPGEGVSIYVTIPLAQADSGGTET